MLSKMQYGNSSKLQGEQYTLKFINGWAHQMQQSKTKRIEQQL